MAAKFGVLTGTPSDAPTYSRDSGATTPSAGGWVEGFQDFPNGGSWRPFWIGWPVQVDTGGSFSSGDDLATDGQGRARAASAGDVVCARALEGSFGAGGVAWISPTPQRVK